MTAVIVDTGWLGSACHLPLVNMIVIRVIYYFMATRVNVITVAGGWTYFITFIATSNGVNSNILVVGIFVSTVTSATICRVTSDILMVGTFVSTVASTTICRVTSANLAIVTYFGTVAKV